MLVLGSNPSELTANQWPESFLTTFDLATLSLPSVTHPGFPSVSRLKVLLRARPQPLGRALRRDVALRHAKHFKTHHELPYRGRAQQRRIIVRVKVPLRMLLAVGRRLVEA